MARAEIQTIPSALVIPQQAVSQLQGNNQVAVVNPDGKAEIRRTRSAFGFAARFMGKSRNESSEHLISGTLVRGGWRLRKRIS
jgi:multidrug efflux pump subunit AcrA (membrane-fusion protein)